MTKTIVIPTQIDVRVGPDGPTCSFTAHLPFLGMPSIGHRIIVEPEGQFGLTICEVYHFIPSTHENEDANCLIITTPLLMDGYDQMLRTLDWFKALYNVENVRSSELNPELYYKFYRNLVHVLGLTHDPHPTVNYDPVAIKIFAESCRAVMLAELDLAGEAEINAAIPTYNPVIQVLHTMVLERKKEEPDGANMMALIKAWEPLINSNRSIPWDASVEQCLESARLVFKKLPSIPLDRLPQSLEAVQ